MSSNSAKPTGLTSANSAWGHTLNNLIAAYIAWIIVQTGLAAPDHPPIHFATPTEMAMRYGAPVNGVLELQALYNIEGGSIYLPREWRSDDLRKESALLHELVHHVQRFNKIDLPCAAAYEASSLRSPNQMAARTRGGRSLRSDQDERAQHLHGECLSRRIIGVGIAHRQSATGATTT